MIRVRQFPTKEYARKIITSVGGIKFDQAVTDLPVCRNQRWIVAAACLHVNSRSSGCCLMKKMYQKPFNQPKILYSCCTKMHQAWPLQSDLAQNTRTTFADIQPVNLDPEFAALLQTTLQVNTSKHAYDAIGICPAENISKSSCSLGHSYGKQMDSMVSYQDPYYTMKRNYATKQNSNSVDNSTAAKSPTDEANEKDVPPPADEDEIKGTKTTQLKKLFALYGSFAMGFHIVISLASLGLMYLVVSSGVDLVGLLSKMGIELSSVASGASTFVVAYAVHKLLMPVRASITLISVPLAVRYLRKLGYFKK